MLERLVGFMVEVKMGFLWMKGRMKGGIKYSMMGMIEIGGLKGDIGWWMVD